MTAPAPDEGLIEQVAVVLAGHRQEHQPSTGASVCACGEWSGPFTMHTGAGAYAFHVADAILAVLAAAGPDSTGGQGETAWREGYVTGHRQACPGNCTHGVPRNLYRQPVEEADQS